jgi:hypothetical protein
MRHRSVAYHCIWSCSRRTGQWVHSCSSFVKHSTLIKYLKQLQKQLDEHAAGNNEIDQPLLDLLQQNIAAAKAANQEKPAEFMQKVREISPTARANPACLLHFGNASPN